MKRSSFTLGGRRLVPGDPLIMGVLNATPDSFSDGGRFATKKAAVARALRMLEEGADILDIGGESSRPGAPQVPEREELRRVIPVIEAVRAKTKALISIDTCKPAVAEAALGAGADIINDITGFRHAAMAELAARRNAAVIVMHMRGDPRTMQKDPRYRNVTADVRGWLLKQCAMLEKRGVKKIVIDPGIGFGKTVAHNLQLLRGLEALAKAGYPVLLGASRKSFIGAISGAAADERLPGTLAAHLWGARHGAAIVRVHDVAAHRQAFAVWKAIKRGSAE